MDKRKDDKQRLGDKASGHTKKTSATRKDGTIKKDGVVKKDGPKKPKETLEEIVTAAINEFPNQCVESCDCGGSCNIDEGRRQIKEFTRAYNSRLALSDQNPKQSKRQLFHKLVSQWRNEPPSSRAKRFCAWMLKQPPAESFLSATDNERKTPMHLALVQNVEAFVTLVLQAEKLPITEILGATSSMGNCVHLAVEFSCPRLRDMVSRCSGNRSILEAKHGSEENTPLHIAVQRSAIQVASLPSDEDKSTAIGSKAQTFEASATRFVDQLLPSDGGDDSDDDYEGSDAFGEDNESDDDVESEEEDLGKDDDESSSDEEDDDYEEERGTGDLVSPEVIARLRKILEELDKESQRPRPPPLPTPTRTGAREIAPPKAPVPVVDSPDFVQLSSDDPVRLLVEASPPKQPISALNIRNKQSRTPYQERVHKLLCDSKKIRNLINELAERQPNKEAWIKRAERVIVAKDPVAHYLRSYCMRKSDSREDTISCLYKTGHECHIEFDLTGMPTDSIPTEYLDQLAMHLKFESILKYVALPILSIETPSRHLWKAEDKTSSRRGKNNNGRNDLVTVFDWLWENGVREIIRIMVVDSFEKPHTDAAIIEALWGFKVEQWDWKRIDLCSDVIYEAAPNVREVSLYSSGNNATLMGWSSAEGLGNRKKFPCLEKVTLFIQDGLEDYDRWNRNKDRCSENIVKHGREGNGKDILVQVLRDNNRDSFAPEFSSGYITSEPEWLQSVINFSSFLRQAARANAEDGNPPVTPVKIAIIDDGIDATVAGLHQSIAGGASFCPYSHSSELVGSYFVPSGKHGTLMAQLITTMCPDVQLFIARLEELPTLSGSGRRVTARSAAKAVDWAVECGVDIISMSWTIQTSSDPTFNAEMEKLQTAIANASSKKILMFCSASDQGGHTTEQYYPSDWNHCIRIGGASFEGDKLTWVDDKVDFWFPGKNVPFPSKDGKSSTYESGSSVATAAASGLAGVLIYASRLHNARGQQNSGKDDVASKTSEKTSEKMSKEKMSQAFGNMATGNDRKFPRTATILDKNFKGYVKKVLASSTARGTRNVQVENLEWNEVSRTALATLMMSTFGDQL